MKTIEKPFGTAAYSKMMDISTKYELACRRYDDLLLLRDKISKGQLNPALYDFINSDKSLEQLFAGLPRPSAEMSCESLSISQLAILDATISDEALNLKALAQQMWQAIREWFMDWWDRNRWLQKDLRYMLAQWHTNPGGTFGDAVTFGSTRVLMYRYEAWEKMHDAAQQLNAISNQMLQPGVKLTEWVQTARAEVSKPLQEFGKFIDENCVVRQGQPTHLREENTCNNMRWKFMHVETYLTKAINLLGNEIEIRREFNRLESVFASGDAQDRRALIFARRLIWNAKENSMVVARTLRVMLNQIIRARATQYRINHPNG